VNGIPIVEKKNQEKKKKHHAVASKVTAQQMRREQGTKNYSSNVYTDAVASSKDDTVNYLQQS